MSTNKTPNLNLHSWVETDPVLMREFNENFNALDAAHAALSESLDTESAAMNSSISAMQTQMLKTVSGSYVGDGTASKTLFFSGAPKVVMVSEEGYGGIYKSMTMFSGYNDVMCYTTYNSCSSCSVTWSGTSVSWKLKSSTYLDMLNSNGMTYHYIAFCI